MKHTAGNYEAFSRPRPVEHAADTRAWIVGAGLAGLSAAVFLVRDAGVPGENVTILEKSDIAGGALDGLDVPEKGFVIRGGRELEDHMECLWDMMRSVPSLEIEGASVLDEFYWLNKDDPNYSLRRATVKQGQDAGHEGRFDLPKAAQKDLLRIFLASREEMEGKRIDEVMGKEFLASPFWMYWRTMFAFEEWHSALEFKLYVHRFVHHIGGLPDFSALKFTKYNQYESFVLPLISYLRHHGVVFQNLTEVTDVDFAHRAGTIRATVVHTVHDGVEETIELGEHDHVLMTIGSLVDNSDEGDHHTAARLNTDPAPAWEFWKRLAKKDPSFGRPEVFCSSIEKTKWESATVTTLDERIPAYIEKICQRDPFSGRVVTGGIVTAEDSPWLMSWTVNRQPHFKKQPKDQIVVWVYGLFVDTPGDYVTKPMSECTGEEITQEWLYQMGVPADEIPELAAEGARCVPVMMPYVTTFFMPRHAGERPLVVPDGAKNFAFLGQFAETGRDTIFTTEYSVRTGMEAVYQLLDVERGVPETWGSTYDVRSLLDATTRMRDGKKLDIPGPEMLRKRSMKRLDEGEIGELLEEYGLI